MAAARIGRSYTSAMIPRVTNIAHMAYARASTEKSTAGGNTASSAAAAKRDSPSFSAASSARNAIVAKSSESQRPGGFPSSCSNQ